jgi:hypothetical protein
VWRQRENDALKKLITVVVELAIITLVLASLGWAAVKTIKIEALNPDLTWIVD